MRNRIKQVIVSALVVAFGTTQAWAALNDTTNGAYLDTGSNSYLRVPNSTSLNITGAITIEAWWRFDSSQTIYTDPALQSTTAVEIVKRGGGTVGSGVSDGYGYKVTPENSSQTLGGGLFGRIAVYQPKTIDNNWHHFAWTFDGSVMRLYYDGQQVNQGNYSGQIGATSSDLYFGVGQLEDGTFYPGTDDAGWYDEIRIWNVARTPSQIAATWNVPLTGSEPNLVGLWNFDSLNGADASPFHNDAIPSAGAQFVALPEPGVTSILLLAFCASIRWR